LRKHGLVDRGRAFVASWVRRTDPAPDGCVKFSKTCHFYCTACGANSVCTACADGYFVNNGTCKKCDVECKTCAASGSCSSCVN